MICISGIPSAGKSTAAEKLSKLLNLPIFCTDYVYFDIAKRLGRSSREEQLEMANPNCFTHIDNINALRVEAYQQLTIPKNAIVEGYHLCFNLDRQALGITKEDTFFYLNVDFETWKQHLASLGKEPNPRAREVYDYVIGMVDLPDYAYTVDNTIDLFMQDYAVYSGLDANFVQRKIDSLKLPNLANKSVIDFGGNSGEIARYCISAGAKEATVVDMNWRHLERAKGLPRILFNLDYIENFTKTADVILCISALHYLKDKEKFIKRCSELAKEFVLECPVDGVTRPDGVTTPTKEEIVSLLYKYFKTVEVKGHSVSPDNSERLVFHCLLTQ